MDARYMFIRKGGKAIHKLGDISRNYLSAELIFVVSEDENNWIGYYVEGYGFIDVEFAKEDCRDASDEEVKRWLKDRHSIVF